MNFLLEQVWTLDTTVGIQATIRQAVIEDDENAARWLDHHLANKTRGYRLAVLWIAYDLLRIRRQFEGTVAA